MKYLIISFLSVFFLGVSCKDKNKPVAKSYCEENPGNCESVTEAKKYFAFNLGSWWVYEEETSGERDSVYVTQALIDLNSYNFDIRTHSSYQGYNYHYWPMYLSGISTCSSVDAVSKKCLFIKKSKGKPGDFIGEGYCFFVNYNLNDFLGSFNVYFENNKIIISEIKESFSLGDLSFLKTIKVHELNTYMEGKQPTNHYYSKGVGLVRKELLDSNQVWNLVNYHIAP